MKKASTYIQTINHKYSISLTGVNKDENGINHYSLSIAVEFKGYTERAFFDCVVHFQNGKTLTLSNIDDLSLWGIRTVAKALQKNESSITEVLRGKNLSDLDL